MTDAFGFFLIAGIGVLSFWMAQALILATFCKNFADAMAAVIPCCVLISLSLVLALNYMPEPYSRYARDLLTRTEQWTVYYIDYLTELFAEVIWDIQNYPPYWLALGLWRARYMVWCMRQLLRRWSYQQCM